MSPGRFFSGPDDYLIAEAVKKERRRILEAFRGFERQGWVEMKLTTAKAIVEDRVPTDGD